ncbi:MAG TPA: pilus assembly protein N-terminal domain-containing protein [Myxococcales bacterium]|jgi:pilus assembly protein CpaC
MRVSVLFMMLWFVVLPARGESEGVINLGVGQQKVIPVQGVERIAIGDAEIADVKQVASGTELIVTGVSEGRTSLLVWHTGGKRASYQVSVRKQDPKELVNDIRALLGEREGVEVRVVGDRVFLDGETITTADYERVQEVVAIYPSVKSFVHPSPSAKRLAVDMLARAYKKNDLGGVTPYLVGNTILLEGWVDSEADLKKLDLITKATGETVESLVTVGQKKMVMVEVDFVEVAIGARKAVGIKPPAQIISTGQGATATVNVVQPLGGIGPAAGSIALSATAASDFSASARFDDAYQRILGQPKLVAASGEKAQFLAGGEVPILGVTQNTFNVEYKKFGILLDVTPTADRSGNIGTAISAEVSTIDPTVSAVANGVNVPGFKVRNVKTTVTVHDGETIVLSGLYNYSQDKEVSKIPLLGSIPILGELFKSRNFVDNKTELAIYVTPHIVTPKSDRVKKLIHDADQSYKDAKSAVSFSLLD